MTTIGENQWALCRCGHYAADHQGGPQFPCTAAVQHPLYNVPVSTCPCTTFRRSPDPDEPHGTNGDPLAALAECEGELALARASGHNGTDRSPKLRSADEARVLVYGAIALGFTGGAWLFSTLALVLGRNVFFSLFVVQLIVTVKIVLAARKVRRGQ